MNELVPFSYGDHEVRVELIDDKPWFVLIDVCAALDIASPRSIPSRLPADYVGETDVVDGRGRPRKTTVVNEPGLYRVIFRSNKTEAERFQRWVFEEVLPSIRMTGSYTVPSADVVSGDDRALMMQTLKTMQAQAEATMARFDHGNRWMKGFQADVLGEIGAIKEHIGLGDPDDERLIGLAFCQERGLPRDKSFVIRLGTVAARLGRRDGFDERKIQNGQGIWVHSWPRVIWEKALDELGGFRLNIVS